MHKSLVFNSKIIRVILYYIYRDYTLLLPQSVRTPLKKCIYYFLKKEFICVKMGAKKITFLANISSKALRPPPFMPSETID